MFRLQRGLLCLCCALACALAVAASRDSQKASADLRTVKQDIARVSRELGEAAAARDAQGRKLRSAEQAIAATRAELQQLAAELAALAARQAELQRERAGAERRLEAQREQLAQQLRVAYMVGSSEPLRLLLGQRDPAEAARLLTWHGYLGQARAVNIAGVRAEQARLQSADEALRTSAQRLQALRADESDKLGRLEGERRERQLVLQELQSDARDRQLALARLKDQQADLERLLRELARVTQPLPAPAPAAAGRFAQLRGRLNWPVTGRLAARFGEQRAGGVTWEGVAVATARSAAVKAVAAGRVVYADWLPGMGLISIIDHGSGYLSLYAHNDALRRGVGDLVAAGDVIAAAGDTGGQSSPTLYFEIRQSGKPVNPQPWFRTRNP